MVRKRGMISMCGISLTMTCKRRDMKIATRKTESAESSLSKAYEYDKCAISHKSKAMLCEIFIISQGRVCRKYGILH